jgi:hypothetical protein
MTINAVTTTGGAAETIANISTTQNCITLSSTNITMGRPILMGNQTINSVSGINTTGSALTIGGGGDIQVGAGSRLIMSSSEFVLPNRTIGTSFNVLVVDNTTNNVRYRPVNEILFNDVINNTVFGSSSTTTALSYQNVGGATTTVTAAGKYIIFASIKHQNTSNNRASAVRVAYIDGTTNATFVLDSSIILTSNNGYFTPFTFSRMLNLSANSTIIWQFAAVNSGTASVIDAVIQYVRIY